MAAGINLDPIATDVAESVTNASRAILASDLSPADKEARLARLLRNTGLHFHGKTYGDASTVFDSSAITGGSFDKEAADQADRLANKIIRNYALSRNTEDALIEGYFTSLLKSSKSEAFANAVSLEKHPTMTRSIVGETCKWCISKAGTYTDPTGAEFERHDRCDCLIVVSGYNSRNGVVKNYVKKRSR